MANYLKSVDLLEENKPTLCRPSYQPNKPIPTIKARQHTSSTPYSLSHSLSPLPSSIPISAGHGWKGSALHWHVRTAEQQGSGGGHHRSGHVHQLWQVLYGLQRLGLPGDHVRPQDALADCDQRLHGLHFVSERVSNHRLHPDGAQDRARAVQAKEGDTPGNEADRGLVK